MSNLNFEGMAIAEGVVETIVTIAVQDVEGVASLSNAHANGILGAFGKKAPGGSVEVVVNEDDTVSVAVRVVALYGHPLPGLAQSIREAVADAVMTQIGITVSEVNVFIDGIQFA